MGSGPKENREILAYMMRLSELPPGAHVLDAGCGTGTLIPYLHEAVGEQGMVEAFDYSRQMLDKAREKFSHLREVVFTEGNILKYDFPDQCYDAVICLNVYPHMAGRARDFIRKMYGTLKRQGSLIIMHDMPRQCVNRLRETAQRNRRVCCRRWISWNHSLLAAAFPLRLQWIRHNFIL